MSIRSIIETTKVEPKPTQQELDREIARLIARGTPHVETPFLPKTVSEDDSDPSFKKISKDYYSPKQVIETFQVQPDPSFKEISGTYYVPTPKPDPTKTTVYDPSVFQKPIIIDLTGVERDPSSYLNAGTTLIQPDPEPTGWNRFFWDMRLADEQEERDPFVREMLGLETLHRQEHETEMQKREEEALQARDKVIVSKQKEWSQDFSTWKAKKKSDYVEQLLALETQEVSSWEEEQWASFDEYMLEEEKKAKYKLAHPPKGYKYDRVKFNKNFAAWKREARAAYAKQISEAKGDFDFSEWRLKQWDYFYQQIADAKIKTQQSFDVAVADYTTQHGISLSEWKTEQNLLLETGIKAWWGVEEKRFETDVLVPFRESWKPDLLGRITGFKIDIPRQNLPFGVAKGGMVLIPPDSKETIAYHPISAEMIIAGVAVAAPYFLPITTTALLASAGAGVLISEGISLITTGKLLPHEMVLPIALKTELYTLLGVGAMTGVSKVAPSIIASSIGRAGVSASIGGVSGYIESRGDLKSIALGMGLGAGVSFGIDLFAKAPRLKYGEVKIPLESGSKATWKGLYLSRGQKASVLYGRWSGLSEVDDIILSHGIGGEAAGWIPRTSIEARMTRELMGKLGYGSLVMQDVDDVLSLMGSTKGVKSTFIKEWLPKETQMLPKEGVSVIKNFLMENIDDVDKLYGSFTQRSQLSEAFEYILSTGDDVISALRVPADIDIALNVSGEQAGIFTKGLFQRLKDIGLDVRLSDVSPTLIEAQTSAGVWRHAVDIHAFGDPIQAVPSKAWGFDIVAKTIKIEGIPSQQLSEQALAKGVSILGFTSEQTIAPVAHRFKDIPDFLQTTHTLLESKKLFGFIPLPPSVKDMGIITRLGSRFGVTDILSAPVSPITQSIVVSMQQPQASLASSFILSSALVPSAVDSLSGFSAFKLPSIRTLSAPSSTQYQSYFPELLKSMTSSPLSLLPPSAFSVSLPSLLKSSLSPFLMSSTPTQPFHPKPSLFKSYPSTLSLRSLKPSPVFKASPSALSISLFSSSKLSQDISRLSVSPSIFQLTSLPYSPPYPLTSLPRPSLPYVRRRRRTFFPRGRRGRGKGKAIYDFQLYLYPIREAKTVGSYILGKSSNLLGVKAKKSRKKAKRKSKTRKAKQVRKKIELRLW